MKKSLSSPLKCIILLTVLLSLLCGIALADQAIVKTPGGTLNMRSGPSGQEKIIEDIPNKAIVTYLGAVNDVWSKVTYKNKTGYVKTVYLNLTKAAEGKTVYADVNDYVAVRKKASDDAAILYHLSCTQPITVLEVQDEWSKVTVPGDNGETVTGYIRTERIKDQFAEPQPIEKKVSLNEAGEMRSKQQLLEHPEKKSEALITLAKGQKVTVEYIEGSWCRVRADNLYYGYVPVTTVHLLGQKAEKEISPLSTYTAVYYTCTVPSGVLKTYVEPTSKLEDVHTTISVSPDEVLNVLLKGRSSHGESWSKVEYKQQVYWVLSSNIVIGDETKTMYYNTKLPDETLCVVYAGSKGAKLYKNGSKLSDTYCTIPAGTELEGVLRPYCIGVTYKGTYGYLLYDEVTCGIAELADDATEYYYLEHLNDPTPAPTPVPTPSPIPYDPGKYITAEKARACADSALSSAYASFKASGMTVTHDQMSDSRGEDGTAFEFAYFKNGKYCYYAIVDAISGKAIYTADYTDFAQSVSFATAAPKRTEAPISGEITKSEARTISDNALRSQYAEFSSYSFVTVDNDRYVSMPGYPYPVFLLNYFTAESHVFSCILRASNGEVLYHADVADPNLTEISFATPTPAPVYESQVDIGQDAARAIADKALAGKYPTFSSTTFVRVSCRLFTESGSWETPYYLFDYYIDDFISPFEIAVHAWTGKVLYTFGSLPGEGNG